MGSECPLRLPTLDFSKLELKSTTPEWDLVKCQVIKALEEYGCFEAVFGKVSQDLRKSMFSSLQDLFDLPLETKLRNASKVPFHGYVGQFPQVPLYESMGIDDANILVKAQSFVDIFWPEGNPDICNTLQSFSEKVSELDLMVRKMVLEGLGVEKYWDEHKESTNYNLRINKYKGPQTTEKKIGLHCHTDKNTITILSQDHVGGLEVQTKDGEWISVKPSSDSFIVVVGDAFYAWTNGRIHSPMHRVMMTGNETRYSLGLFAAPRASYIIKAPEELVDEQHPLLFKPYDHVEFLGFYYSEAGRKEEYALKAYCGA